MSKESYARGFVKAAAAAGVDPTALAKFAQQYKTEGYFTGVMASVKGHMDIPKVYGTGYVVPDRTPAGWGLTSPSELERLPDTPEERVRQIVNPRHLAWLQAHTNALSKATAPLREAGFPQDQTEIPEDIQKELEKIYHSTMYSTTSAPPARVSAPANK